MAYEERLAAELVSMAEEQFAVQAPLADLLETDEKFARWASQATTLALTPWTDGPTPPQLRAIWVMADRHDVRLDEIVRADGWPGRSRVGEDGADAAWVLAQHADRHLELRRAWVPLLERAVAARDADPRHLARLVDRVALADDQPQLFGTYASLRDSGEVDWEIQALGNATDVDARRRDLGLPALEDDLREPANAAPYRYMRLTTAFAWPTEG